MVVSRDMRPARDATHLDGFVALRLDDSQNVRDDEVGTPFVRVGRSGNDDRCAFADPVDT